MKITQKHPVYFENKWQKPIDIYNNCNKDIEILTQRSDNLPLIVYNFVLEKVHVIKVNDICCVTFGHNIKEAYHSFYGTNEIIETLKKSNDYSSGFISLAKTVRCLNK